MMITESKTIGFFLSVSGLGSSHSEWDLNPGGLLASVGQMGMGFGAPNRTPSPSSDSQGSNNGVRIPCTELYVKYVHSEGKVKIVSESEELVMEEEEGVKGKKKKAGFFVVKMKVKVKSPSLRRLISGAFAGAISRTCVAPLETIRTHLMVGSSGHSTGEVFQNIMKTDGWKGLFRGNFVNVIRVAPSKAIEVINILCIFNAFCRM
ncbi:adenine nucleotide transporter BT1, chloroplastic/mitochondrial [Arachis ipaensis]|uniref:adenine nucleotide transporter BT1, chloroplastic/mitochondrial n=1 Tax=Arachis ipaensis TaxID=130454 RepID=UPI000A2B03B4|nr:adenine nucleotide transporter BT1, chloroplastic/mitochondrial [Arachis ipaensis]